MRGAGRQAGRQRTSCRPEQKSTFRVHLSHATRKASPVPDQVREPERPRPRLPARPNSSYFTPRTLYLHPGVPAASVVTLEEAGVAPHPALELAPPVLEGLHGHNLDLAGLAREA